MKKALPHLLIFLVIIFPACKKSNTSPPSVIGTWVFSNVTGSTYNTSSAESDVYSYDRATDSMYISAHTNGIAHNSSFYINNEILAFNSDGTYKITESYYYYSTAHNDTFIGTWEYMNNTKLNNAIVFNGTYPQTLLQHIPYYSDVYNFQIRNNTLVFTSDNSFKSNSLVAIPDTVTYNFTITFTKK